MRNSGLSLIQHMPVSFLDIFYIVFVLGEFYFWLFIFSFYSQRFPLQAIHVCSELWRKQFVSSFSNTSMPIYTRKHTCICKDKKSLLCMSRQHHACRDVITMHLKAACQGRIEIRHGGQCGRCEVALLFKAEALIFLFFYCFFCSQLMSIWNDQVFYARLLLLYFFTPICIHDILLNQTEAQTAGIYKSKWAQTIINQLFKKCMHKHRAIIYIVQPGLMMKG